MKAEEKFSPTRLVLAPEQKYSTSTNLSVQVSGARAKQENTSIRI